MQLPINTRTSRFHGSISTDPIFFDCTFSSCSVRSGIISFTSILTVFVHFLVRILFASGRVVHDDLQLADESVAELEGPVDVVEDVAVQARERLRRFDGRKKSREVTFDGRVDDVARR